MNRARTSPSPVFLEMFARELAHWRNLRGLTQAELAAKIIFSTGHVGMVESTQRAPTVQFAERCDGALDTGGLFARLQAYTQATAMPGWFRNYVELEETAIRLQIFECQNIPGLFQTEEYARAVLEAWWTEKVEDLLSSRTSRQATLSRSPGPKIWVLIDEAVMLRPIGGPEVIAAQLRYLAAMAEQRRIVAQVIPFDVGAHPLDDGAMTILSFEDSPDVVYLEGPGNGQLIDMPEAVAQCQERYDLARAAALSPEASVRRIKMTAENWEQKYVHI